MAGTEHSLVYESLPSKELWQYRNTQRNAAFQRRRASFLCHKSLSTNMHYMQAFSTHTMYKTMYYLQHPKFTSGRCKARKNNKKLFRPLPPPPAASPWRTRKGPRIHCRGGPTRGTSIRSKWRSPGACPRNGLPMVIDGRQRGLSAREPIHS